MSNSVKTGPQRDEVQAHRGASAVAPENTLAAFRAAAEQGAQWVELDVALLADGTLVVIHDDSVDRTTSGTGSLGALNKDDLDRLDAGSWFGASFAGERVPTLSETLQLLGQLGLGANIEIKQHEHHRSLEQLTTSVRAALRTAGATTRVMISSFDPEALAAMHRLEPGLEMAMLWSKVPPNWQERLASIPATTIHLHYKALSIGLLEEAGRLGIKVRVWTCNEPAVLASFWPAGLSGVITDNPAAFLN
ncbi:MAG TPA: glycerophosphodiester phosphodiesterase family protein [Devosia sp.]|jgi:glycerophosphoryl diester phosphodiesterase|uniref:glycerophosphodiester phosphodiesterase family protein n=1 Tax=Devosia sp. TaxID=1871048 RepID=UPI002F942AFE